MAIMINNIAASCRVTSNRNTFERLSSIDYRMGLRRNNGNREAVKASFLAAPSRSCQALHRADSTTANTHLAVNTRFCHRNASQIYRDHQDKRSFRDSALVTPRARTE